MFTVYNNGVVDYKGSVENLYNIKNINEARFTFDSKENLQKEQKNSSNDKKQEELFLSSYKKISQISHFNKFFYVKDVMVQDVLYIDNSHTVKEAYELLIEKKATQIPVVTTDKKIVGVIDPKFILSLLIQNLDEPNLFLNTKLEKINFNEIITTTPDAKLKDLVKIMFDLEIGLMVVADEDGTLRGVISKSYIFKAMSNIPQLEIWS